MTAPLVCLLITVAAVPPVEAPLPVEVVVRRHAVRFLEEKPHLAIVIGVTSRGERRVWGFGGYERNGERVVPDGKTVYEIGSITKTFTGTILADLVRDGTVRLDDPVKSHLPSGWTMPTRDDREISLLQLSTHTSSLPRMPPGFDAHLLLTLSVNDPYSRYGVEELRYALTKTKLHRPIGSRHEYSNLGMGLLGLALARADVDGDVDRLFQERLLTPLKLSETTFTPTDEQRSRMAPPFNAVGWPANNWHFDCLKACGGLHSTADDMLAYAEAAMGQAETPLTPSFELATQPWRQTCEGQRSIGLGWYVQPVESAGRRIGRLIWHGGGTGGYSTFLGLVPERSCAVVILSNSTNSVDPVLSHPIFNVLIRESAD